MPLELNTYSDIERGVLLEKAKNSMGNHVPENLADLNNSLNKSKKKITLNSCKNTSDFSVQKYYCNVLNGLNSDELEVFKKIFKAHLRVTDELNIDVPMDILALLHAFNLYRKICALTFPEKIRILEVSSGAGYLGYILVLFGYKLCTTEPDSQYYIYQNRMWRCLSEIKFIELASKDDDMDLLQAINGGDVVHVPWWEYSSVAQYTYSSKFDMIVSHIDADENESNYSNAMYRSVQAFNLSDKINFYLIDTFPQPILEIDTDWLSVLGLSFHVDTYKALYTRIVISSYASERFSFPPTLKLKLSKKMKNYFIVPFFRLPTEKINNIRRFLNPFEILRLGIKCGQMVFTTGGVRLVAEHAKSYLYGTTLTDVPPLRILTIDLPVINHLQYGSGKTKNASNEPLSPVVRDLGSVVDNYLKEFIKETSSPLNELETYLETEGANFPPTHSSDNLNSGQMEKKSSLDFVFIQPPRVGGSCVTSFFNTLYPDLCRFNLTNFPQLFIPPDWVKANLEWLLTISPYKAVVCNYYVSVGEIAKIDSSAVAVTILRDPIERICSEFLEYRRSIEPYIDLAHSDIIPCIQDVLIFADHFHRHNFYVRFFSRTGLLDNLENKEYDMALHNLKQLSYVGVTEKMERMIGTLCAWLPKDSQINMQEAHDEAQSMIESRFGRSAGAEMAAQLTPSARDRLLKCNSMDYDLYNVFRKQIDV